MIAVAPVLIWYDFATSRGSLVLPSFLGVSMVRRGASDSVHEHGGAGGGAHAARAPRAA